jgi:hypothetical protein
MITISGDISIKVPSTNKMTLTINKTAIGLSVTDVIRLASCVGEVGVWEARASYNINKNFRVTAEAINILSEPKNQYAFVQDDRYEVNDYGPRIFFGVRGRF